MGVLVPDLNPSNFTDCIPKNTEWNPDCPYISQDGWQPHHEGRWHAEAGGKWTFTKNGKEYGYLNKRCWEVPKP